MQFKPFTKSNKAHKFAAPTPKDAKTLRFSQGNRAAAPINGQDYVYGLAHIKAARKNIVTPYNEYQVNPMGWILPGAIWTDNNGRVQDAARKIDQMIRMGGGLPKNWLTGGAQ